MLKKIKNNKLFRFLFLILLIVIVILTFDFLFHSINYHITSYLYLLLVVCIMCWNCRDEEFSNNLKIFINSAKQILPIFLGIALLTYLLYSISGMKNFSISSYVYAFPEKNYSKNYRVIANIDYNSDYGYQITKIYFDNGGYIEFNFCEKGNNKGNLFYCEADNDDRNWYFRYYGEKVEK